LESSRNVFGGKYLSQALRAHDIDLITRCLQVTERFLDKGDSVIHDAMIIRVVEYLFDPAWHETILEYAGATVRRMLTNPDNS
jgi:hypothetical protein